MKVILVSHLYPRCKRDYYMSRSRTGLSSAADAHQYAIALGLNSICHDFEIVNVPAVSHFPIRYKDLYQTSELIKENGLLIHNVGYNNLIEYQLFSRYINVKKTLDGILKSYHDIVYIVLYGINFAINKAVVDIKFKHPTQVKICNIIPDLPQDINNNGQLLTKISSFIHGLFFAPAEDYFKQYDSFVFLTKYMNEVVNCPEDRYIVSEGIYEEEVTHRIPHIEDPNCFKIFYGGMLYERFGITNLLDAFRSIDNPKMRLQLCGYGDCVERVKRLSNVDPRIEYLGVLPRDTVLELQSKASLLVNPRVPDNNPFTRYSFPSKTMEYFASGTPTLLYQLDGIPSEYYRYCYSLNSGQTSCEALKSKIIEIYNMEVDQRLSLAQEARRFILEKKNARVAGKMIFDLLQRTM